MFYKNALIYGSDFSGKVVNILKKMLMDCDKGRKFSCFQGIKDTIFKKLHCIPIKILICKKDY